MDDITHETSLTQLSMHIDKASRDKQTGIMRLRMVNSDTGEDVFGEKMSSELFDDFIRRSNENLPVPEPFDTIIHEDAWKGGPPYLSIAHNKSGIDLCNVPGKQEKLYLDGNKLKSVDILHDTPLGNAVWKSIYDDLYSKEKSEYENPVRVSIGFVDLEHKHEIENEDDFVFTRESLDDRCELCDSGVENKVYLKGHLVHKAFTRVPAHPRTDVEIEMKSNKIITKEEDTKSIIGDVELEQKSTVEKNDLLVVKAEKDLEEYAWSVRGSFYDEFSPPMYVRAVTENSIIVSESGTLYRVGYDDGDNGFSFDKRSKWERVEVGFIPVKSEAEESEWRIEFDEDSSTEKSVSDEVNMKTEPKEDEVVPVEDEQEDVVPVVDENKSKVDTATDALKDKIAELKEKGVYGDSALEELQPLFTNFGEVVKSEVVPEGQLGDVAGVVKSAVKDAIPEIVSQLVKELSGLTQAPANTIVDDIPVPRSVTVKRSDITEQGQKKLTQIQKLAGMK